MEDYNNRKFNISPESTKIRYYPALDWLRFVLASVVVLYHQGVDLPDPISGGLAVQVFLALSGWLIGGILLKTEPLELPRFFYNRVTRIWPPYVFTVFLLYLLAATRQGIDTNWFEYLFYDVTFTHYTFVSLQDAVSKMPLGGTGGHFWSISIEEQFYLFAPVLILFVIRKRQLAAWLAINCLLLSMQSPFSSIALGITSAIINNDYYLYLRTKQVRALLFFAGVISFAALSVWMVTPFTEIFAVLVVMNLATPGSRQNIGGRLGAISYPLYLNHWIGGFFIQLVNKKIVHLPGPISQISSFVCSVMLAYTCWYMIDRKILARRASWYSPKIGRICLSASYILFSVGMLGGCAIALL